MIAHYFAVRSEWKSEGRGLRPVRMLLVDQNRLFREGLSRILVGKSMEIVAEANSLVEACNLNHGGDQQVDLVVCDPAGDSDAEHDALAVLTRMLPGVAMVLVTEQLTPRWLASAIDSHVKGFLPKNISGGALRLALEIVLLDEQIFPASSILLQHSQPAAPASYEGRKADHLALLSPREKQILTCLIEGQSNKAIAESLSMAEATVKVHLKSLLRKINVDNRTQAAIWGMQRR